MPFSLEVSGESHVSSQTTRTTLSYFLAAMLSLLVLGFVALLALPEIPTIHSAVALPLCLSAVKTPLHWQVCPHVHLC